jgi:hypothetical protein
MPMRDGGERIAFGHAGESGLTALSSRWILSNLTVEPVTRGPANRASPNASWFGGGWITDPKELRRRALEAMALTTI